MDALFVVDGPSRRCCQWGATTKVIGVAVMRQMQTPMGVSGRHRFGISRVALLLIIAQRGTRLYDTHFYPVCVQEVFVIDIGPSAGGVDLWRAQHLLGHIAGNSSAIEESVQ